MSTMINCAYCGASVSMPDMIQHHFIGQCTPAPTVQNTQYAPGEWEAPRVTTESVVAETHEFMANGAGGASYSTADSAQGVKHDADKPMVALVPASAVLEEAKVWTFGAKKYGAHNWRKGLTYLRILSALLRHTFAIVAGEDTDAESGLLHAAHIRCCAGMLIEFQLNKRTELDDRAQSAQGEGK